MPTLLQIAEGFHAIDNVLEENGGDISDPKFAALVEDWFVTLQSDLAVKCDQYAAYIRELVLRASARTEEAERLLKAAKSHHATADFLKARLKDALISIDQKKVEGPRYTVSIQKNGGKQPLTIKEGATVPPEFLKQPPPVPDNDLIRSVLESGVPLDFAFLAERGTQLRIR